MMKFSSPKKRWNVGGQLGYLIIQLSIITLPVAFVVKLLRCYSSSRALIPIFMQMTTNFSMNMCVPEPAACW